MRERDFDDGLFAGFALGWSVAREVHGIEHAAPPFDRVESVLRDIAEGRLTLIIPVADLKRQNPDMMPQFEAMLRRNSSAHVAQERDHARRILRMISGGSKRRGGG